MRTLVAVAVAVAVGACGDDGNLPAGTAPPDVVPLCAKVEGNLESYADADFGPYVRESLAGWDPDGRWFVTGGQISLSASVHFERQGRQVIQDRLPNYPGTVDKDTIVTRIPYSTSAGEPLMVTTRISNLRADGTARIDRAKCDAAVCNVCTAVLERATYNAGEVEGDHLALVGKLSIPSDEATFTFNVRVVGTIAYLLRYDGLYIVETADPAHPVLLGSWRPTGPSRLNDVKLVEANGKRYALLADVPVDVVEVTDPAQAHLVAQIPVEAHTLFTELRDGHAYAYFGALDGTTPVFDVTDPETPLRLGAFDTGASYVHDLMVDDGIAYLNAWEKGLDVVDFTNPSQPALVGTWRSGVVNHNGYSHSSWAMHVGGKTVALHGDENWGAHLDVVDVTPGLARFSSIGSYQTRPFISIHNVMAVGSKAYMTYYQDGVRVLDMQDPTRPKLVGYFNTWDPQADDTSSNFYEGAVGLDVDPVRKLIFVADSPRGLLILRDETP